MSLIGLDFDAKKDMPHRGYLFVEKINVFFASLEATLGEFG